MKLKLFNLKITKLLLFVIIPFFGISQTTIINSTTVGGFEGGATFAANGWTSNNPAQATRNQWACSTGATGYTGSRCAYITDAFGATPPTHNYNNGSARQTHFYRDITIPAGHTQIALSFSWRNQGESTDRLAVWVVPTSYTPTYGTAITASGTAPTGNIKISGDLYNQAAWTTASYNLPATYANTTVRLVFEWINDGSAGTQTPAAVDNISLISNVATGHCTIATTSSSYWISNFTTTGGFANINNNTTYSTGGYGDYYATQTVSQIAGGVIGFSMTNSSSTHGVNIWVDWNNDFDFADVGEKVYASGSYVSNTSGSFTVPGGTAIGNYRLRIVSDYLNTNPAECGSTTYTEAEDYKVSVVTPPTCFIPLSLTSAATSLTTGTASWSAPTSGTAPIGYEYVISTSSATPGGAGTAITALTQNFTGLTSNTTYYVFVRSNCGAGDFSTWTSTSFFTGYCSSTSTGSSYYINNFSTTGGTANITNNGSGYSATGYGNFSAQTVSQQQYGTVNFSAAFTGGSFGFNIWVDWNNDLDFSDSGELVYIAGTYVTTATGSFTVPSTATVGNHRMRIVANYNSTNPLDCGSITSGETEDYTFNVIASTCPGIPTAVTVSVSSTTTATVNWTASSPAPASGYQIYLSTSATLPTGATTPTYTTGAGVTTLPLTGLTANTTYYVYVRNNCGSGNVSPWTSQVSFFTGYCVSTSSGSTYYINNFSTTGGTANITNNGSGYSATGYGNFTGQTVSQQNYGSISFSAAYTGGTFGFGIWVDWNNDLDFDDVGELMYNSGTYAASNTGSFTVPASATVGNHRMRIRANYNSTTPDECGAITSGETEDYTFNVLPPPACANNPSSITVFLNSQTAATVSWTAPTPAPASGYQYYLSTSSTTPTGATTPTGSTAAAVTSVSLTGLTSGTTYYIWIRSNCGGGTGVGVWVGPTSFTMPTCSIGSGNGTTTLGCPDITTGGLGLSGTDPAPLTCGAGSTCVDLEATYLQIGETTNYTVQAIAYAPPYQFNCLRNPVSVNIDDRWSPIINLPFDFCFYGNNYNQCLMSSNGVITFDTTTNTPGGYSDYSFADNLPSTNLFMNSIFGVYHDIDPSISGEVGWELITLNTGCRALVASWNNIPMFSSSCNSQLYTGMIVLYENTNIIEVYIKEKNVCASWNDGNAVVGLQNANGTQAVVPAGRNSLDTDWTVTNQAYRFTPSGAAISTITWYEGSGTSGPVVGSSDVISVCPAATTTYTAEIEYTLCNGSSLIDTDEVTVTVSGNKVWTGATNTNWNISTNWSPVGVPTSADCVVIPDTANDPIISGTSYSGLGKSLAVNANATLNITATNAVTITDAINVNAAGNIVVQDDASIVQVNNVVNTGNIDYQRIANIRKLDYVYWSSPVTGFANSAISPSTSLGYQYKWTPTIASNTNGFGNWVAANETMVRGKGYIVRGPDYFTSTLANYTATFTGVPNNGNITIPISRGTYNGANYTTGASTTQGTKDDDNWNLVGNPYPSAIHAINFLTLNTNIAGFINIWTHGTLPSSAITDPFYGDYVYNYTPTDYITYNSVGTSSGPGVFNGRIAGGQGFFVSMLHTSAAATENLTFNNALRSNTYNNTVFYRDGEENKSSDELEKHRIWFDIVSPSGASIRSLLGYVETATNQEDRLFDAFSNQKLSFNIFSLIEDKQMLIQGRKLPFDENDKVKIGVSIPQDGLYKIALSSIDGLFLDSKQNIYLEDKLLNVIFNLKEAPYSFMANKGNITDRFIIRYNKNGNITEVSNQLHVYDNNVLTVESGKLKIKDIVIYDTLGKLLLNKNNVNNKNYQVTNLNRTNSMLVVKVTLEDNTEEVRKIIY